MTLVHRIEARTLAAALALPERVQARIAGRPLVLDGQTLAPETQLMLRLQRVSRMPGAESLAFPAARDLIDRQAAMTGGRQPIGAVRDLEAAGLPARLYTPSSLRGRDDETAPLLVFFHGGGFMYGGLDSHDAPCRVLAERGQVRVMAIDYRLAPEHPFPAAHDDVVAAYEWAVENAAALGADRFAVGGDSAGGNLAAHVAIHAARAGLPLDFQLLVYPITDVGGGTRSRELFGEGLYLTTGFIGLADASYRAPAEDPRISVLVADLPEGLAPAYVATAGFDPLRDEGEAYARRLSEAGVTVELRRYSDQIHGFFNIVGVGRRSPAAVGEIADALRTGLRKHGG
ncbi:alpha/beta hydrolase [Nocardioides sp. R-C-SC26]|uniref:alpha/beta hydrolase n=1 Tax=Nocardioides sp. R-C-SC26 TaxID=2870414 RepID=UPI001E6347C6|nr:alpha/beta hydrolase [Nocardioides sp. R-C-SC26]